MSTLPRSFKSINQNYRTDTPDFDSGINASAAWQQHLDQISDEDQDVISLDKSKVRPARVLYNFEGKPEFRELSVLSGDKIQILEEDLADGWSLVRNQSGEDGLLPRSYYTVRLSRSHSLMP